MSAVLFDYGGTLVDVVRPHAAIDAAQVRIAAVLRAAGHTVPSPDELRKAVHDRIEAEVSDHEAGGALEEIDLAALERRAFADIGIDVADELRDRCAAIVQEAWMTGLRVYPDTVRTLGVLRAAGLRLGICSNAAYRPLSMREQLHRTGLDALLDAAVFSGEVGWRKPSPRLFLAALESLRGDAATTVFVGDRLREDVAGARGAGMRAVLITRSPRVLDEPVAGTAPDAIITTLDELPGLLVR